MSKKELLLEFTSAYGREPEDGDELYKFAVATGNHDLAEELWAQDPTVSISDDAWSRFDDEER